MSERPTALVPRWNVLGIRMAALECAEATDVVIEAAAAGRPLTVSALAVHGVMTGVRDPVHQYRLNDLDLLLPDGQPIRWALGWLHGVRLQDRTRGTALMSSLCDRAASERLPVFLFGGTDALLASLGAKLTLTYPGLRIAGVRASRFRRVSGPERDAIRQAIRESGAALTFVGLGCPRQEVWLYEQRDALPMPLVAVGAAFDFLAGHLPQAPTFMQHHGLEWLHRLWREPTRLWRRYVVLNPWYLALLILQKSGLRRWDPAAGRPPDEEMRFG